MSCCITDREEVGLTDLIHTSYQFEDILTDKHTKYTQQYTDSSAKKLFWGLGIENETYLMMKTLRDHKAFSSLKPKRERYSVDYYKNFKEGDLQKVLNELKTCEDLTYPIYINSHTFQSTSPSLEHRTFYDVNATPNSKFTESIHNVLLRENEFYRSIYEKSFVFDGDSIEFITQAFENTTISACVNELRTLKQRFQEEITPFFEKWNLDTVHFPDHNYGLVSFLTTRQANLGVCNNGTIHLNLTLPTFLENGSIINRTQFASDHLRVIRFIQTIEPLMVASYGTPDVFSIVDPSYSVGSLRVSMSRYISVQTFDPEAPINGKLLLMKRPEDALYWQNRFVDSPYIMNENVGYDINFAKFKNHGIEIRFFDWFPEEYLESVMNFFVLLAEHALHTPQSRRKVHKDRYQTLMYSCIHRGFAARLTVEECNVIMEDLSLPIVSNSMSPYELLCHINDLLYELYRDGEQVVHYLSPGMKKPVLVNYNFIAFQKLYRDVYGKPQLILRAELNPFETRAPLTPVDLSTLQDHFRVLVESSTTRCYSDDAYRSLGATIVPAEFWKASRHSYVIGLKEIQALTHSSQTLLHFAHCFKGQEGWLDALHQLAPCRFIDYEYMLDREKKRVISFCGQSGKVGCYLALITFYIRHQTEPVELPPFNETVYREILQDMPNKPRVILIGYGTVGKRCKAVLDSFNIECTIRTSKDIVSKEEILQHDILLHAIRLPDDPSIIYPPFLTLSDLGAATDRLSVICDISCDMGNPRNTLPLYSEYTSKVSPVHRIPDTDVDIIAINNLPSLEPTVSSEDFSSILAQYLPALLHYTYSYKNDPISAVLYDSYLKFQSTLRDATLL